MIANKKERVIIANSIADLYKKGQKVSAKDVPLGSVIIVETPEDDEFLYQIITVYRTGKTLVRGASDYYGQIEDDIRIAPNEQVVVLTAATVEIPELSENALQEKEQKLRTEVKERGTRAVIFLAGKARWIVSQLRHDKSGLPTSAWVVDGGWRLRIKDGSFFCGGNKLPISSVQDYRVVYLPKNIADMHWNYDQFFEWAEKEVPSDAGAFFSFLKPTPEVENDPDALRREVQEVSTYAVLISDKAEHYLTQISHDREGNFVCGIDTQNGVKVRIVDGSFRVEASDHTRVFKVNSYQMIYIPEHVRKSSRRYDQIIDWATESVPTEFRVTKQMKREGA